MNIFNGNHNNMLWLKIITDISGATCFSLGGWNILWMRRYLMPVIFAIAFSIDLHIYWIGITVLPVIGTLCLGYFFHGNQGLQWLGRGLWLSLQGLVIGAGVTLSGHLSWYVYLLFVLVGFGLGASFFDIEQILGDIIFGIWLGSIVLFVR